MIKHETIDGFYILILLSVWRVRPRSIGINYRNSCYVRVWKCPDLRNTVLTVICYLKNTTMDAIRHQVVVCQDVLQVWPTTYCNLSNRTVFEMRHYSVLCTFLIRERKSFIVMSILCFWELCFTVKECFDYSMLTYAFVVGTQ